MRWIGIVEAQPCHGFERNARAALRQTQSRAQFTLEERCVIVLVVANPVLATSERPAPVVNVVRIGVEVHARHAVLIPELSAAVRIRSKPLPCPRPNVVAEPRIHEELCLRREPVDVTHANIMDD